MLKILGTISFAILLGGCSSLLYHQSQGVFFPPAQFHLKPDEVTFMTSNQKKLHGWYFHSPKKTKALIVFFHGNAENLTSHYTNLRWALPEGFDYFIFDYEGYGESEGTPTPRGTVEDGKAAIRWAHAYRPKLPLIVFGQSLGGAISLRTLIEMKNEIPIKLCVIEGGLDSYEAAGAKVLAKSWLTWPFQWISYLLLSDRYAPGDRISEISPVPIWVIHGTKDQTVDYELGRRVFEKAKQPKEFWSVENGQHLDAFWAHDLKYRKKFIEKVNELLAKR
ncbi:MAG: alpha/beta hydrolase fold containing protein [Bacteriovoracaceae bacterium]|nr:alpha/beta hydrolase fold containing protein [Bacteriovoracaceae bacterium]